MKKSLLNFKSLLAVVVLSMAVISCEEKDDIAENQPQDNTVVEIDDEKLKDFNACSVSLKKEGDLLEAIHSSEETPKYFKWSVDGQPISNYNIMAPTQTFDLNDPNAKPVELNFDFTEEVTYQLTNELPLERLYNIEKGDINIVSKPLTTGKHTVCVSFDTIDCNNVEKCFEINYVNRFPVKWVVTCVNDVEFVVQTQKIGDKNFSSIQLRLNDALGSSEKIWFKNGEKLPKRTGLDLAIFTESEGELSETNVCVVIITPNCSEGKQSKQFCDVLKL